MKARVKATGEIVCIERNLDYRGGYVASDGRLYNACDLELIVDEDPDYWTKLEHQYAGMAMQSYVSNNVYLREIREMCKEPQEMRDLIADLSILIATTLIQKLKEKEKNNE